MAKIFWLDEDLDSEDILDLRNKLTKQRKKQLTLKLFYNFIEAKNELEQNINYYDLFIIDILLPKVDTGILNQDKYGIEIIKILLKGNIQTEKIVIFSNEHPRKLSQEYNSIKYCYKPMFGLDKFVSLILQKAIKLETN